MQEFRILDASVPEETQRWLELWQAWPGREISAHPNYARLFASRGDRTLCASLATEAGTILFPLILRPVHVESWATDFDPVFDLTSPYGYGGPFAWGSPPAEMFWWALDEWAGQQGVVSLFARLSLFPNQLLPMDGGVHTRAINVVRSLETSEEDLWMDYKQKVRKNVKTARKAGLALEVDLTGRRLSDFLDIYHHTMDRRDAAERYYFSDSFFADLIDGLQGGFVFFHALAGEDVISSELVLVSADHMYSFLGGTLADKFALRPNDFLKHEAIRWGQQRGKKDFVLGGGYEGRDGILRYKRSFAPDGDVPFRVFTRVFDPEAYRDLVSARRSWELASGQGCEKQANFFPEYRGVAEEKGRLEGLRN